jgi:hypothetical protein
MLPHGWPTIEKVLEPGIPIFTNEEEMLSHIRRILLFSSNCESHVYGRRFSFLRIAETILRNTHFHGCESTQKAINNVILRLESSSDSKKLFPYILKFKKISNAHRNTSRVRYIEAVLSQSVLGVDIARHISNMCFLCT